MNRIEHSGDAKQQIERTPHEQLEQRLVEEPTSMRASSEQFGLGVTRCPNDAVSHKLDAITVGINDIATHGLGRVVAAIDGVDSKLDSVLMNLHSWGSASAPSTFQSPMGARLDGSITRGTSSPRAFPHPVSPTTASTRPSMSSAHPSTHPSTFGTFGPPARDNQLPSLIAGQPPWDNQLTSLRGPPRTVNKRSHRRVLAVCMLIERTGLLDTPFDELVPHLDTEGVQLSITEQDQLRQLIANRKHVPRS